MYKHEQQGGALMISLVLIFMMTLMGISSMRSATLEKRMAANSVHKSIALQAAESATELALGRQSNLEGALVLDGYPYSATVDLDSEKNINIGADVAFKGIGAPLGFGLGAGSGFTAYRYEATGTASIPVIEAQSQIVQGAYRIAPSPAI